MIQSSNTTTAQSLGALLKSARDIMRKDKGLNGDLDRLPMLTWIMFLKFLDDLEFQREGEWKLVNPEKSTPHPGPLPGRGGEGKRFKPAIEPPYRWRDWAAKSDGITGDELLSFINSEECALPHGPTEKPKRGPGLFRYLRGLTGHDSPGVANARDVIATVFKGVQNRMVSGYLLRDVINKLNGIHFTASDELHTLGALYESMLREMRDAAGDSGEFYTPRAVVRFMVTVTNPRLGETVLDPASGTGGFLVEAFNHLSQQVKTVADRKILQEKSLFGCEPKTLPYLLCQMNLLLHGLDAPQIDPGNSLRFKLTDIGERDRVDVILTNPPFGGEEEKGIQGNFPEDKQTAETALLFLQLIMRKLRRQNVKSRAAVVVSDGFLSTKGVAARVKDQLLSEFNLHTVVRLPRGVFVPYTPIATNLLFFDRSGPTKSIWYYEIPGPSDRQTYSKTKPFRFEEFADCLAWWADRSDGKRSWLVGREEIVARGFDMDLQNPNAPADLSKRPPSELIATIEETICRAQKISLKLKRVFDPETLSKVENSRMRKLGDFLRLRKEFVTISDGEKHQLLTVQLRARGICRRSEKLGSEIKTKKQQIVRAAELVVAEIDAKMGGFAIVPQDCAGAIVSSHYFIYEIDESIMLPRFLEWWLRSGIPEQAIQPYVKGSTNYAAIRQHHFPLLEMRVPLPDEQRRIVADLDALQAEVDALKRLQAETAAELDALLPAILDIAFKGEL